MNWVRGLVDHYWFVGVGASAVWTVGSVLWTLRAERKFRILAAQQAALDELRASHAAFERYADKLPTIRTQYRRRAQVRS